MDFRRITRHLLMTQSQGKRAFPRGTLAGIEVAIKAGEASQTKHIRFAVEGALPKLPLLRGQSAQQRAVDVLAQLRSWDTDLNDGVLIYLLLADQAVEILAGFEVSAMEPAREWACISRDIETACRRESYEEGVIKGIQALAGHLVEYFPA